MVLSNPNVMTAKANKSSFCARQEVEAREVFESEPSREGEVCSSSSLNRYQRTYMKQKQYSWRALRSASLALVLAASAAIGQAQTFVNPKTFDTGIGSWIIWNGWGLQGWLTVGSTLDAANDPNSGSLRYDVPFTGDSGDQFMTFGTLHDAWGWDGTTEVNVVGVYTNITFDFKLDPATAPAKDGTFGTLAIGLVTDGWSHPSGRHLARSPPARPTGRT